jgi:flagellar protein FliL
MLGQRPEAARGGEEKHAPQPEAAAPAAPATAAPAAEAAGGLQAWLPLAIALVIMPLLAYGVTTFVLVPRLQKALHPGGAAANEPGKETKAEGETPAKEEGGHAGQRQSFVINHLLVNVAGTMGSRYLLTSITLMGDGSDFANRVQQKEPQLKDMANGLLSTKTIADLEKPGARNLIRGELLNGFNSILGTPGVQEIYFTEFAIQ